MMTRENIKARMAELQAIKAQQQEKLHNAQQEQRDAMVSLERIEGAMQDVQYWMGEMAKQEAPKDETKGEQPGDPVAA